MYKDIFKKLLDRELKIWLSYYWYISRWMNCVSRDSVT